MQGYVAQIVSGTTGPEIPETTPDSVLSRLAPAIYADDSGGLVDRGNAREISNAVSKPEYAAEDSLPPISNLGLAMMQLLASHEIALTPENEELINVSVPEDDPVGSVFENTTIMPQHRSEFVEIDGTREQVNVVTSIFDGSTVYGSDQATTDKLRTHDGTGQLRTSESGGLPLENGFPIAGDVRVAENPNLQSVHELFMLEHNRLAGEIAAECAAQNLSCSGDAIFNGARQLVAATQEKIFYQELLPVFLGTDDLESLLPNPAVLDHVSGALNEYTAAAGRVGHTMMTETILVQSPDGDAKEVPLADCFFNMGCLGGATLEEQLYGMTLQETESLDSVVTDGLRNAMLPSPNATFLIDLYATNLGRGRDHGLPDYMTLRELLGFESVSIEELLPQYVLDAFPDYLTTGIDAVVGMFAEFRLPTQYMGETASAIWAAQFLGLQNEHSWYDPGYGLQDYLDNVSMISLMTDNTDLVRSQLPENVFVVAEVPLPASGVLLLASGGALAVLRRRKQRVAA